MDLAPLPEFGKGAMGQMISDLFQGQVNLNLGMNPRSLPVVFHLLSFSLGKALMCYRQIAPVA